MEEETVKVYIEINANYEITKIFSSDFEEPTQTSIKIDEGYGDKFRHAQNLYLPKCLCKENGDYQYKYVNNQIMEV